jgi:hypothetical protein
MSNKKRTLGDSPIEEQHREVMNTIAFALDKVLNGEEAMENKIKRKTGFVLLVFPFGDQSGRCNYISNGADRDDVVKLMKEQVRHFEQDKGEDDEPPLDGEENMFKANMDKVNAACHGLRDGQMTREECRQYLIKECSVADHNLDMLLDVYDPVKNQ